MQVIIYDAVTRQVRRQFTRFKDKAYCGTFRSDNKLLVAGGEDGIVQVQMDCVKSYIACTHSVLGFSCFSCHAQWIWVWIVIRLCRDLAAMITNCSKHTYCLTLPWLTTGVCAVDAKYPDLCRSLMLAAARCSGSSRLTRRQRMWPISPQTACMCYQLLTIQRYSFAQ